ncbi:MAG: hypothetical protein ACK5VT_06715 [Alphaproteobacteria bacterium]
MPGRRAWSSFAWSSCLVVVPGRVSPGRRAWSAAQYIIGRHHQSVVVSGGKRH